MVFIFIFGTLNPKVSENVVVKIQNSGFNHVCSVENTRKMTNLCNLEHQTSHHDFALKPISISQRCRPIAGTVPLRMRMPKEEEFHEKDFCSSLRRLPEPEKSIALKSFKIVESD